jgi:Cu2+-exporting ATPase
MSVLVAAGERAAVDGQVRAGRSELDASLITGETLPEVVGVGGRVFAGTLNLGAPLTLEVTAVSENTLLAEIVRLMEHAEQRRARYVALADRIARLYAPAVHGLALATFLGWTFLVGVAWQVALLHAVAVLIITCPCALGLAVPVVQVIASGRLMRRGILLKSGTALERLAEVDTVVFDKTGTLTLGHPALQSVPDDREALELAASLAAASRHPLARALAGAAPGVPVAVGVQETPGCGLSQHTPAGEIRLGNRDWCAIDEDESATGPELWLTQPGRAPQRFAFADPLRGDAKEVVAGLEARGLEVQLLSGDRETTGLQPGRQGRASGAAGRGRAEGVDGGRRPERCAGADGRQRLPVADQRCRYQPDGGGRGVPGRPPGSGPRDPGGGGAHPGAGQTEPGARLRLQRAHGSPGGAGPGDPADRRGLHVGLVARRDWQRAAPELAGLRIAAATNVILYLNLKIPAFNSPKPPTPPQNRNPHPTNS